MKTNKIRSMVNWSHVVLIAFGLLFISCAHKASISQEKPIFQSRSLQELDLKKAKLTFVFGKPSYIYSGFQSTYSSLIPSDSNLNNHLAKNLSELLKKEKALDNKVVNPAINGRLFSNKDLNLQNFKKSKEYFDNSQSDLIIVLDHYQIDSVDVVYTSTSSQFGTQSSTLPSLLFNINLKIWNVKTKSLELETYLKTYISQGVYTVWDKILLQAIDESTEELWELLEDIEALPVKKGGDDA